MIDAKVIERAIDNMATLKYFPASATPIGRMLSEMCSNNDQVVWLSRQMMLLNEWPGPGEMRRIFCTRFRPADGMAVTKCSCGCDGAEHGAYTFPLAPEQVWPPRLEAAPQKLLPSPAEAATDPEWERETEALKARIKAAAHGVPHPVGRLTCLRDVFTAPQDRPEPAPSMPMSAEERRAIQEQLLRAERENRERKARGEPMPWEQNNSTRETSNG